MRQLAKKLESSKPTAKCIKQVSTEPQATQIHLLRHQCTELPPNKYQRKQRKPKQGPSNYRYQQEERKIDRPLQEHEKYRQEHNKRVERCHKSGDTPHIEGFRYPASRHRCKHCSKTGHFSHLCFRKKQESTYKKSTRNPKAYQLKVGRYSTEDSLYKQDTNVSESKDSFCLQMQIKKLQADQESCDTQHLVTNLQYKVKPHRKKTKFLRAKIDMCSNTNVMPASIYKILYNDPDGIKLQPCKKKGMQSYTKQKIPMIGSCEWFGLHPNDQCFHKVKFQVVSVEGSVIISCTTSINLNLIQIPKQLDNKIPDCAGLIYSSADAPDKHQYKVQQSVLRTILPSKKYQEAHMQPQKPIPESYNRLCSDRTCQSTRCYKINCKPKRQKIPYNQSVKSRKDQDVRSPKVISPRHCVPNNSSCKYSEKKIQSNRSKSPEDTSLKVTSKNLSPRGSFKKSQVQVQEKIQIPKCEMGH